MTQSTPADKPASAPSDSRDGLGAESSDGRKAAPADGETAQAEGPSPEDGALASSVGDGAANGDPSRPSAESAEDGPSAAAPATELDAESNGDPAASPPATVSSADDHGAAPEDASASPPQAEISAEVDDHEPAPEEDLADGDHDAGPGDPAASALQAELERAQDQRIRLAADFDNYRKRTEGQLKSRWNHAQADLLARLLDPLDDLGRVTDCDPETATAESLLEGVAQVERKFARLLEEAGVDVVDPLGEPFDPTRMEAMMRVPADSEDLDDVVQMVMQRGFTLKGQLLRPARVAVYKAE